MKKALMIVSVLVIAVISTACINNMAVQELNNKADEFMAKGDYESAMNRLQASLDLDATMYQTYYNLGVAAINANKYDVAIEALEGGIKIKPDFDGFYYSLGLAQSGFADELQTNAEGDNAISGDKNDNDVKSSEDLKSQAVDLKRKSIENLEKYLEMSPDSADKETILALIKESEDYIKENTKAAE